MNNSEIKLLTAARFKREPADIRRGPGPKQIGVLGIPQATE